MHCSEGAGSTEGVVPFRLLGGKGIKVLQTLLGKKPPRPSSLGTFLCASVSPSEIELESMMCCTDGKGLFFHALP